MKLGKLIIPLTIFLVSAVSPSHLFFFLIPFAVVSFCLMATTGSHYVNGKVSGIGLELFYACFLILAIGASKMAMEKYSVTEEYQTILTETPTSETRVVDYTLYNLKRDVRQGLIQNF